MAKYTIGVTENVVVDTDNAIDTWQQHGTPKGSCSHETLYQDSQERYYVVQEKMWERPVGSGSSSHFSAHFLNDEEAAWWRKLNCKEDSEAIDYKEGSGVAPLVNDSLRDYFDLLDGLGKGWGLAVNSEETERISKMKNGPRKIAAAKEMGSNMYQSIYMMMNAPGPLLPTTIIARSLGARVW